MRFENVSLLVESLVEVLREMGYCWRDKEGLICSQKGVFRVNCIDCLDRTNVVQVTSFAVHFIQHFSYLFIYLFISGKNKKVNNHIIGFLIIFLQTALAKAAMEIQLYKLGLIPPEGTMPITLRSMFQQLWANNGDIISKQYAGTNALKVRYIHLLSVIVAVYISIKYFLIIF